MPNEWTGSLTDSERAQQDDFRRSLRARTRPRQDEPDEDEWEPRRPPVKEAKPVVERKRNGPQRLPDWEVKPNTLIQRRLRDKRAAQSLAVTEPSSHDHP